MGWGEALTALLSERSTALKRFALLLCGDDTAADDLLQEALVRALGRPFTRSDPHVVEAYVRRIMVNLSVDHHRADARWRRVMPVLAKRNHAVDVAADVADRADILAALAALSPRQRACVVLRFYEDLTAAQAGEVLGCSDGAIKRYTSEALARLATMITPPTRSAGCP